MTLDATHDPARRSWVESANGHPDFPIQNLPLGIYSPPDGPARPGTAIGDMILDLNAAGLLSACTTLNAVMAEGAVARRALRQATSNLLEAGASPRPEWLHAASSCTLHLPAQIGDYTDFYVGIHHAMNVGKVFRPDNPLLPNYKHVPIGYHGRASSVQESGVPIRRPLGQTLAPGAGMPSFGPCRRLDFELELAVWIGPGNQPGEPIPIETAADHIAGYCLLNDWSARDIQAWEYQPLGPFLAKNFASTISPWIITPEALAPFRTAQPSRPDGDPQPLPYLWNAADQTSGAIALELEVFLLTPAMKAQGLPGQRLSLSDARHMYWTFAQMVTHHTCGGCNLRPGDLLGSGTISAPLPEGFGSLLEMTKGGTSAILLDSGEQRQFIEDGDEIILQARARNGHAVSIGFGSCRAQVLGSSIDNRATN